MPENISDHTDTDHTPPELDQETLEFFQAVFDLIRSGDAQALEPLLDKGLPANVCNHKGDSLLMLASYHGHLEATRLLLSRGADPELRNDQARRRCWARPSRATPTSSTLCWTAARR